MSIPFIHHIAARRLPHRMVLWALLGVVLAPSCAGQSPTSNQVSSATAARPNPSDWVVLVRTSDTTGLSEIRIASSDGSKEHRLVIDGAPTGDQAHPVWSPRHDRVAFDISVPHEGRPPSVSSWVVGIDGRGLARISDCHSPCVQEGSPAWSPDGGAVVMARQLVDGEGRYTGSQLEILDLSSGTRRIVASTDRGDVEFDAPAWERTGGSVFAELATYGDEPHERVAHRELVSVGLRQQTPTMRVITTLGT